MWRGGDLTLVVVVVVMVVVRCWCCGARGVTFVDCLSGADKLVVRCWLGRDVIQWWWCDMKWLFEWWWLWLWH